MLRAGRRQGELRQIGTHAKLPGVACRNRGGGCSTALTGTSSCTQVCDALEDVLEEGGCIVDHHGCDLFPERCVASACCSRFMCA